MAALGDDPKTPAKKVKTGANEKLKHVPLHRTGKLVLTMEKLETIIKLVGSTVVTHRPTSISLEVNSEEEATQSTPRPRNSILDDDDDYYQTPVALMPAVT